jgi:hypothetical protein
LDKVSVEEWLTPFMLLVIVPPLLLLVDMVLELQLPPPLPPLLQLDELLPL